MNTKGIVYSALFLVPWMLLYVDDAQAQRSGQSMSVQTGVVVAAQAVNMQSAAGSGTANVRRVSPAYCDAAFDNAVDKDISAEYGRLADMCLEAKERMMETETDEALDKAIRRVKILCND